MFLATNELGLAFGHVAHLAPVARGLARRGIATAAAVRDVVTAAQVADRPFARILQAPVLLRPVLRQPTLTYAQVIADGGLGDADHATALVAAWLQLFDGVRPDGIVSEFAPLSLLAAHVAGLRSVRTGYSWAVPPATVPLPSLMPWLPDDPAARTAAGEVADRVIAAVCRRFEAPCVGLVELLAASPRFLGTWPEFDHFGVTTGEVYYGPMTGLGATARPAWPDADGPRVFVYLAGDHPGTVPLVDALCDLGWPTIWHARVALPMVLPPSIRFSPIAVDTAHVLAQAQILAGRGARPVRVRAKFVPCPGPPQHPGVPLLWVVAAALIDLDRRVLVAQRDDQRWEFPGGKIEPGETPEAALVRELAEELGIETAPSCLTPCGFASHHTADVHLALLLFACRNWGGTPTGHQGQAVRWLRVPELYRLAMPPADVPLIDQLDRLL